jgi:hypothetical protein
VAKFFSFNEASLSAAGPGVPLSPIFVAFNVNPGAPNGGPASGFRTEPNTQQTHNVPFACPAIQSIRRCGWWRSTIAPIGRQSEIK